MLGFKINQLDLPLDKRISDFNLFFTWSLEFIFYLEFGVRNISILFYFLFNVFCRDIFYLNI